MKIINTILLQKCGDDSQIIEIKLAAVITKTFIFSLGKGGNVQYLAHFKRPIFKINVPGIYNIQGVAGEKTMRVHLFNPKVYSLDMLLKSIEKIG